MPKYLFLDITSFLKSYKLKLILNFFLQSFKLINYLDFFWENPAELHLNYLANSTIQHDDYFIALPEGVPKKGDFNDDFDFNATS